MLQTSPRLNDLAAAAAAGLAERFGGMASVMAVAPGRVNLIGEHIDYCDGFVLPFAIDRCIVIAGRANGTDQARITTAVGGDTATFHVSQAVTVGEPGWSNYVRGVVRGFQDRGLEIPGFDAFVVSSLPRGAGLSSSAALECATATFLEGLLGIAIPPKEKALLCQKAEQDFAGVPCGIMDQFASVFGQKDRLILIDCRSQEPQLVPFQHPGLTALIANTGVHHELSDGSYADRRKQTEAALAIIGRQSWREVTLDDVRRHWDRMGDPIQRRARHVVSETQRTVDAAAALSRGDFEALGPLMAASHASLRDDFEVSCRELDILVAAAEAIGRTGGVVGSRMSGGGFGGSTVTLCESGRASNIARALHDTFRSATGAAPQIFISRPSQGARLIQAGLQPG